MGRMERIALLVFFCKMFTPTQELVLNTSPHSPAFVAVDTVELALNCSVSETRTRLSLQWIGKKGAALSISNTTTLAFVFGRVKYSDVGVYHCQAVNQTSGLILAQKSVTVNVGDPPPVPPPPTVKYICGYVSYPPKDVIISYQYNANSSVHYPVTTELFVSSLSEDNYCMEANEKFDIVKGSQRTVLHPGNDLFEVNVGHAVKELFPHFPSCDHDTWLDCNTLCGFVRARNVFGETNSQTMSQNLVGTENCGVVADFKALTIKRDSVKLAWNLPRCLRYISELKQDIYYWLWCEPSCGNRISVKTSAFSSNRTINSLVENTNYTFFASCSFSNYYKGSGESVSVSVQTKEGVPRVVPIIIERRWLSKCRGPNDAHNGTALVSWKITDKDALFGEVRYYVITSYQASDSTVTTTRKRKVRAGVHQLEIPGLRMDQSHRFTIKVCTGGGCGKASPAYNLLPAQCDPPGIRDVQNPALRNVRNRQWIWGSVGGVIILTSIVSLLIYFVCHRKRTARPPLLPQDINPTESSTGQQDVVIENDHAYADAVDSPNCECGQLGQELEDKSLSRSSSLTTCDTDL